MLLKKVRLWETRLMNSTILQLLDTMSSTKRNRSHLRPSPEAESRKVAKLEDFSVQAQADDSSQATAVEVGGSSDTEKETTLVIVTKGKTPELLETVEGGSQEAGDGELVAIGANPSEIFAELIG